MSNERLFYEDNENYITYTISKKNICHYCKKEECICDLLDIKINCVNFILNNYNKKYKKFKKKKCNFHLLDTTYNCVNCNVKYLYRQYKKTHLKCEMCEEDYCTGCSHLCRKIFNVKLLRNGILPKK